MQAGGRLEGESTGILKGQSKPRLFSRMSGEPRRDVADSAFFEEYDTSCHVKRERGKGGNAKNHHKSPDLDVRRISVRVFWWFLGIAGANGEDTEISVSPQTHDDNLIKWKNTL